MKFNISIYENLMYKDPEIEKNTKKTHLKEKKE